MSDKFVCLYILKITMNEWKSIYRKKKNIFQQNNFNLFAVLIGFMISITFFAYSQAKQQDYQIPTGNNYSVGSIGRVEKREEIETGVNRELTRTDWLTWGTEKSIDTWGGYKNNWNWGTEKTDKGWSKSVLVKGFPEDSLANKIWTYAYELDPTNWKEFMTVLKCENWNFDMYLQSSVIDENGNREPSYWFCQMHRKRHSAIVDNPLFWSDWKRQVEQCYNKRKGWTKFYWPNRPIYKNWKYVWLCKDVVKNDFTLISK